ncbi:transcriptional regulator [Bacillus sp. OxB-1]|uniref:helix-turn-helix domain-containing protein n=1 Tax=Bacillus sp. (strain OxB-1) TaxID=98228 RepID=UPI0005821003|nr:helix-turn-helix domain-containing protein [Bacillus sp. OxB-1]BAQ09292.1 transcriptional regulator [Bacillus sp. OxB-1]
MDDSNEHLIFPRGKLKDSELTILVDSIRSITSSLDLNDVLEKIMKNALKIIPLAQGGYLLLYDNTKDRLIPKAPVGFDHRIYDFQVKVGESITGTVFQDGIGRLFKSEEEVERGMRRNNISETNYVSLTTSSHPGFPSSFIAVPISIAEKRIGVMTVHQWRGKQPFDEHDLLLLQGFAEQAAIAIQNAQYYAEANDRIKEVTHLSKQLEERNFQLQKRYEVHEALTNISLENKGLETIIREFNQMISKPVFFYNVIDNLFYFSYPSQASDFTTEELKKMFAANWEPQYVEKGVSSLETYYLLPIHNGSVFLGCFIIPTNGVISESDRMTLEQGSSIIAMELIKKQTVTEYFYKKTYEQFRELLSHRTEEHLKSFGSRMGVDINSYWYMAIIEIPSYNDLQQLEIEIHQLVLKIQKELRPQGKMIFGVQNRVFILSPLPEPDALDTVQETLATIQEQWVKGENPPFLGGISAVYKGLENVGKCYDEAEDTINYLSGHNRFELMQYENIGLNRLFLHQQPHIIEQFINEVFFPLSHEANSELERTILVYMKTNRSAREAAKKLHIHPNTLYQRIKKIEDLLQIDLDNSDDILKVHLACYLKSSKSR